MNLATWGKTNMAGLKGKSGPPGNMNAFKHGLAAIQKRREEGIPTEHEEMSGSNLEAEEGGGEIDGWILGGDSSDVSRVDL